jgi:ribonuclease P protein component
MLPKKYRLPLRHLPDFFLQAKKIHTPHFVVYQAPQPTELQASVVVPAKVYPLATDRNTTKRRVGEAILPLIKELEAKQQPAQVVVYVKKAASQLSLPDIAQELRKTLS